MSRRGGEKSSSATARHSRKSMSPSLSEVSGPTGSPLTFTGSSPELSCLAVEPLGSLTSSGCMAPASSSRLHVMTMTLSSLTEMDGAGNSPKPWVRIAACSSAASFALNIALGASSSTSFATPACAMAKMGLSTSPDRHSASLRARLARLRSAFAASAARSADSRRSSRARARASSTVRFALHRRRSATFSTTAEPTPPPKPSRD
mmetsp:Transcript_9364/g.38297  ORF Transcript_9364/g.38297 Transcript_9364/m.38297 type:complete len:205 (+) Transcript_9364:76-690(+)